MSEAPKKDLAKKSDDRGVEFVPFGASEKIRLTAAMVRNFIAVPTKSGAMPSERDCIRFLMLCQGKRANPFEGDCFLIGYDSQQGATFSLVCGLELFLKRAEQSEDYDGYEAGVTVERGDPSTGEIMITERKGSLVFDGEKLVAGWAKVYRKGRTYPVYKIAKFSTYDTGKSRWAKDPGGMICKVALSQALRETFPTALGGLYAQEEMEQVTRLGESTGFELREPIEMPKPLPAAAPKAPKPEEPPEAPPASPALAALIALADKKGKGMHWLVEVAGRDFGAPTLADLTPKQIKEIAAVLQEMAG